MKIKFVKSAPSYKEAPQHKSVEVAFAGRSNSGKSSFINALAGRPVAKVSKVPGKTRLLNFFDVGEHYSMVDMPGYGYAARSNKETDSWRLMVEDYIFHRKQLKGMVLVMDVRRSWAEDEEILKNWLFSHDIPLLVVLSKGDKLSRIQRERSLKKTKECSGTSQVFCISSPKKWGVDAVEDFIFKQWIAKEVGLSEGGLCGR